MPKFSGLKYENLGVNGLTSDALATMVGQKRIYSLIQQSKIISITIASNDLLAVGRRIISGSGANFDLTMGNLSRSLILIGESIRTANPSAIVKIATIYNPLPPMDKQLEILAQGLVKTTNRSIINVARQFRFDVIPVDKAFGGREQILLGTDHLHPNIQGHKVIADLFCRY
jgi:lysophospholipase L1-like esterase